MRAKDEWLRAEWLRALGLLFLTFGAQCFPGVVFDHPTQDFVYAPQSPAEEAKIVMAIRGIDDPAWGPVFGRQSAETRWLNVKIILEINAVEVLTIDALDMINAHGEVKADIQMPSLPPGEHVASCRCTQDGVEAEEEDTVSFYVAAEPLSPPASVDEWGVEMLGPCPHAQTCTEEDSSGCSGHGSCVNGACICFGDWTAEDCSHSVLEDVSFLPPSAAQRSISRCLKTLAWEKGIMELDLRIEDLGSARACEGVNAQALTENDALRSQILEGILLFGPPTHGLGFNIHYLSHMLAWGLTQDRIPVMVESEDLGVWEYGRHCYPQSGWPCYFQPISGCDRLSEDVQGFAEKVHSRADGIVDVGLHPLNGIESKIHNFTTHGQLWWRAQLVNRLVRPSASILNVIRKVKNVLGLREPYISVHIRMGDSCTHKGRLAFFGRQTEVGCRKAEDYLNATLRISDKYGVKTVFLATDDSEAVEVMRTSGLEIKTLNIDRNRLFKSSWLIETRIATKSVNTTDISQSAIVDLLLLSEGDYFVGSFGGHMSRLAFELMVGAKGYVVPYISVDRPWCFRAAQEYGTGFIDFC